ncbi:MAG: hypothetical protein ABS35_45920 [Kaistia sp. SCN 65-12]|nr:MAG: hypothetical protein ABS35_45920 [Kaistia sp. SCN 65-12]
MSTIRLPRFGITTLHAALALASLVALGATSGAQTPTKAQQSAIRSACPDDYRSYCASVPPGGQASLACLQQNAAKLSDACRSAVQAVGGGAAAAPADAATTTPPASKPAANGANKSAAPAANAGPAAPAPAAPAEALTPRQELALVRQACARDVRTHCRGVPIGGGNVVACLKENAASLSTRCQSALAPFAR